MGVLLGLLSALAYGSADFCNGVGGRRADPAVVPAIAQPFGLLAALVGVLVLSGHDPSAAALGWGALSGVGNAVGTFALIAGFARGSMGVVAPLAGVVNAVLPVAVGLASGDHVSTLSAAGLVLALPAIALVAAAPGTGGGVATRAVVAGVVAGLGFGGFFVALAQAGTGSGAWPLVPGQVVAVVLLAVLAVALRDRSVPWRSGAPVAVVGGVLGGIAGLLYLASTGHGELAIVAVLASLYPGATVVLARLFLHERWSRLQAAGLGLSVVAVVAISTG